MLYVWNSGLLFLELPPPTSEWAIEQSEFDDFSQLGFTGEGVRVCMVDTGIDLSHPALSQIDVKFKDMIGDSSTPTDYGYVAHGTLMAGILVADQHQDRHHHGRRRHREGASPAASILSQPGRRPICQRRRVCAWS